MAAFVANSGPAAIQAYYAAPTIEREALRNRIIYSRIAAYDIEYQAFQADLIKEANIENISADLIVLGLNGAGATAGGVGLKAALAAASAGVVGAKASIDKQLFFDRAVPALLAQMSAARAGRFTLIQKGLQLSDDLYPLPAALVDANAYREAGSLPVAIDLLTANATAARTDMKATEVLNRVGPVVGVESAEAAARASAAPALAARRARSPGLTIVSPGGPSTFFRNLP
ncbi:hypothetical protein [Methylobacterium oryzisoli]|uniref:hypothetical protein n=1 Tax=Methylobacterium oryzisoli TaxID=3385502 RepID=UPI003891FB7B